MAGTGRSGCAAKGTGAWAALLLALVLASACRAFPPRAGTPLPPGSGPGGVPVASPVPGSGPNPAPVPAPASLNPLTGLPVPPAALQRRVLLVAVDNNPRARPQYGLPAADLVYELPVEGGLTRFIALYLAGEADQIGPVRSARHDMLDLVLEWDAAWVHAGESPQHTRRLASLSGVANLDDLRGVPGAFWRGRDRRPPHNLYTSTARLRAKLRELGWERPAPARTPFRFLGAGEEPEGQPAPAASVYLPRVLWERVTWVYDSGRGRFQRYVDGKPHRDGLSGRPLEASNVLVQYTAVRPIPGDPAGRQEVPLVGSGELKVLSGGRLREGRWEKADPRAPTRYLEAGGEPLALVPGPTWIMVVPRGTRVEVREQP